MNNRKGFTLVEMLVVIAVIGIISTVALTALGPSRNRAKDSRIISGLNQIRAIAEVVYDGDYDAVDPVQADIAKSSADITANGGQLVITRSVAPSQAYEAHSRLASNNARFYCVDSSGATIETVNVPNNGVCPAN